MRVSFDGYSLEGKLAVTKLEDFIIFRNFSRISGIIPVVVVVFLEQEPSCIPVHSPPYDRLKTIPLERS
jgi:hypothetical protein